jgi:hypothetical protein
VCSSDLQRVDEMRRQQEEAKRGLEEAGGKPDAKTADELARRQEELRKAAAEAAKILDDVQKRMEEFPSEMPLQEMAEARKSLQDSGLMEQLSEIAEQMRSGQFSEASEGQQQAMQKMDRAAQQLQPDHAGDDQAADHGASARFRLALTTRRKYCSRLSSGAARRSAGHAGSPRARREGKRGPQR